MKEDLSPPPPASLADKMVGGWGGRMWLGAAAPLIVGAQTFGGEGVRAKLAELEQMKQRGMAADGKEGTDWYGMLGAVLPTTGIASGVAKVLPAATGLLGKIGVGAAQGAAAAAATPSGGVTADEYFPNKAWQIGRGAALSAGLTGAGEGVARLVDAVKSRLNPTNLGIRHMEGLVGKENMPVLTDKLVNAKPILPARAPVSGAQGPTLPSSHMTVAEAVADLPAGSPWQALQERMFQTSGGGSQIGGEILADSVAAQTAAKASRDAEMLPTMFKILDRADVAGRHTPALESAIKAGEKAAKGTIPKVVSSDALRSSVDIHAPYTPPVLQSALEKSNARLSSEMKAATIENGRQAQAAMEMLRDEGLQPLRINTISNRLGKTLGAEEVRVYDTTQKTLGWLKEKLQDVADKKGNISGRDLWAIRKEAGIKINAFAQEDKNFDKRFTAQLISGVQGDIDTAIEKAGGAGWGDALKRYSSLTKNIDLEEAGKAEMYKPLQRTSLGQAGAQIAKDIVPNGPPILNRYYTVAKYVPQFIAGKMEPKVDRELVRMLADAKGASQLIQQGGVPSVRGKISQALLRAIPVVSGLQSRREHP